MIRTCVFWGRAVPKGKYIKLLYDDDCTLVGASTDHFLLEKSRLVKVDSGERGYHIFYQVLLHFIQ